MITILIYLNELLGILAYYNYLLYGVNFATLIGLKGKGVFILDSLLNYLPRKKICPQ